MDLASQAPSEALGPHIGSAPFRAGPGPEKKCKASKRLAWLTLRVQVSKN